MTPADRQLLQGLRSLADRLPDNDATTIRLAMMVIGRLLIGRRIADVEAERRVA